MNIQDEIKELFLIDTISFSERIFTCEILFEALVQNLPDYITLCKFIDNISFGNDVKVSFVDLDDNIFSISFKNKSSQEEYKNYISNLCNDDSLEMKIEIKKNIIKNHFTIYNYSQFTEDLLNNSLFEIMQIFSKILNGLEYIIFNVLDENVNWNTKTMIFSHDLNSCFSPSIKRVERIELCKITSYFQSGMELSILPDDFDIKVNTHGNPYVKIFKRINTTLSISYISSISSIDSECLKCTINGQRNVSFKYDIDDIENNGVLYNIYDWIYTDGNPVDKSIIARNIISLHCKYSSLLDVDPRTLISITSNYEIYLKENVSKYLEAKTKVSEFISDIGAKLGDNALELFNRFKNNVLAIFSFLLTVVLVNIVSQNPLDNIFTKDITALVELILLGSAIYFLACLLETIYKYEKTNNAYNLLRRNYEDIFSEEELNEIFNNDEVFKKCKKIVIRNIVIFSALWILFFVVAVIVIENISTNPFVSKFIRYIAGLFD